ncbi:uncharacterized [Tachysurus ichikawai]
MTEKHSDDVQVGQMVQERYRSVKEKTSKMTKEAEALKSISELERMMQTDPALSLKGSSFSCLYVFDHIAVLSWGNILTLGFLTAIDKNIWIHLGQMQSFFTTSLL